MPDFESTATQSFCSQFDPVAAGKLLDDAGWKLGSDNIRAKNGIKLKLTYNTTVNAVRQATQFSQGIEQGKVDILRATQVGQQAYNDALVKSQSVQNAQTALRDAMQNEISKQTEQINAAAQVANQQYQQGQLEQQRSATAQTNALELQKLEAQRQAQAQTTSTEREKIDLSRQQGRGRRLPQVRYA